MSYKNSSNYVENESEISYEESSIDEESDQDSFPEQCSEESETEENNANDISITYNNIDKKSGWLYFKKSLKNHVNNNTNPTSSVFSIFSKQSRYVYVYFKDEYLIYSTKQSSEIKDYTKHINDEYSGRINLNYLGNNLISDSNNIQSKDKILSEIGLFFNLNIYKLYKY